MVVRITTGKHLPKSIAQGLLLDQARRCVADHSCLMASKNRTNLMEIKKSYGRMDKARHAYESASGKSLEESL